MRQDKPAGVIGASNFFELSVAVAIAVFGVSSPVALVTIVDVLVAFPVMLIFVRIANKTRWATDSVDVRQVRPVRLSS